MGELIMSEKELAKSIKEWVKYNFGESEADDPSWDINALAHHLSLELKKKEE